jgi:phenylalanyl-tRNA synthetase beta chain
LFELDVGCRLAAATAGAISEVSRFPAVVRDLALVVALNLAAQALHGARKPRLAFVTGCELFDVYQGKGVDPDKKSLAFRVVMQDTQKRFRRWRSRCGDCKMIEAASRKTFAAKLRS